MPKIKKKQTGMVFWVFFLDFFPKRYLKKSQDFLRYTQCTKTLRWSHHMPWYSDFSFHFLMGGSIFQTLINTSLKNSSFENQSVLESSGDTDSESERFQFCVGTLIKLSQSSTEH